MAPTLPVRAGSGRADGGNGVTIGRIGSVIEHECGLEMILTSPDDLPPTAANPDEVGDLEQYLDAADVAVVGVLLAGRQRSRAEMLQNAVLLTVAALLVEAALIQLMGGSVGGELLSEGILMGGLLLLALLLLNEGQ